MTRAEHMAWCKQRALEYVERGEPNEAIASMISDLGKHPETTRSAEIGSWIAPIDGTLDQVKHWIYGFN